MEVENVNVKKLFPERKLSKKGLVEFINRKGFYIVLILCVAIIGATAVFLTMNNPASPSTDLNTKIISDSTDSIVANTETANSSAIKQADAIDKMIAANTTTDKSQGDVKKEPVKKPDEGNKEIANPKKPTSTTKAKVINEKFIKPVFGDISFDYSQDKLVYSKTLDEWRTHSGVDLGVDRGTPVKVVADGIVIDVKNDPRFGITVIIDHQNGIKTVYANLASDEMVTPNQKVKQGEVIGSVGNTALFEQVEQTHLHFEVLKDNLPVNPANYLPKK